MRAFLAMHPASRHVRCAGVTRLMLSLCMWLACLFVCVAVTPGFAQETAKRVVAPTSLSLTTNAVAPHRFVAVHGRRALIDGYAASGLEVWAYPVQLIRGYRVGFRPHGTTSEISGATILRRVVYRPDAIVRIYLGPNFIVRETLFVPLDKPAAIVTYSVESRKPVDIVIHFVPVLNLMWPAGIGGQDTGWDPGAAGYVMTEQTHRFSAVVGSTDVIAHDEIFNSTDSATTPGALAFTIRAGGVANKTATVVIASTDIKNNSASTAQGNSLVSDLTQSSAQLEQGAIAHYTDVQTSALQIETPDKDLNRDLAWSEIALDQAWVCNPYLGCGMVAGYGPSRGARRPQYAWFFAGDGMIAADALISAGRFSRARDELDFIAKYQDPNTGMIWHEMSQSAGLIDWVHKYPYMFVHVDISFQYLNTVADYVAASGDKRFLHDHWHSVQAAYRYCQSLIDPHDGLPRIPAGKEGGDEQDKMSDALTLSASWVQASQSFANMATWMGDTSQAAAARQASEKARQFFAQRYWDEKQKFWVDGYSPSGKEILDRSSSGSVVFAQHLFSSAQENTLLDQLASPNFQTDWGTRSNPVNSTAFNPDSYAKGSVWAVGTGTVATAFWADHRPATALPIWSGLIPWNSLDSLGHMDEVLAGDYFHEQTESVPEQTWSSAMFFRAAVQGLLGLQVDALQNQIVFAPHMLADWNNVTIRNIPVSEAKISLTWTRTDRGSELDSVNTGAPVHLVYSPEIPLGAHLTGATWDGKPILARLNQHAQESDATVTLDIPHGTGHLILRYAGGVSLILPHVHPLLGDASHAIKVIGVGLHGATYTLHAEVDTAATTAFQLRTDRTVVAVHGATWKSVSPNTYALTIAPADLSGTPEKYASAEVVVDFAPR